MNILAGLLAIIGFMVIAGVTIGIALLIIDSIKCFFSK